MSSQHPKQSTPGSSSSDEDRGYWGENPGTHVDVEDSTQAFRDLGRQLSSLSTRSQGRSTSPQRGVPRKKSSANSITARLGFGARDRDEEAAPDADDRIHDLDTVPPTPPNLETPHNGPVDPTPLNRLLKEEEEKQTHGKEEKIEAHFDVHHFVPSKKPAFQHRGVEVVKRPAVVWKNLTVKGVDSSTVFNKNAFDAVLSTFGPDFFHLVLTKFPSLAQWIPGYKDKVKLRTILDDFSGSLDKEMLLVLGRPGSGASTFLKAITSNIDEYADVSGDVYYAGLDAQKYMKKFPGDVVYNHEADLHFPTLTVGQTLWFAIRNNIPRSRFRPDGQSRSEYINLMISTLLKMLGIAHTEHTMVGNEYIRGVSGGERKRVSIAEVLATRASFAAWDNSTRGLDSSTALDYVRSLRLLTDVSPATSVATLYQASDRIYNVFDKVMLIHEGLCIYFGPASEARAYFEDLGYYSSPRTTTADFLTGITNPAEAVIKPGYEKTAPRTPQELRDAYRQSKYHTKANEDIAKFDNCRAKLYYNNVNGENNEKPTPDASSEVTLNEANNNNNNHHKNKYADDNRPSARADRVRKEPSEWFRTIRLYFISVYLLTLRQFWLKWGEREAFRTKTITNIVVALVTGAMFFEGQDDTSSLFARGGSLFFSLLFLGWLNLAELVEAHTGRPIIVRHKKFNFYRPSAVAFARVISDIPLNAFQGIIFAICFYFMAQLRTDAGAFFKFLLMILVSCLSLTSMFRAIGSISPSIDSSVRFSVMYVNIAVVYAGYAFPRYAMPNWFKWIYYVQPVSYGFEALLGNELGGQTYPCAPASTISIPGSGSESQSCLVTGSRPGSLFVTGDDYLSQNFDYKASHYWRNFGIVIAFTVAYILFATIASEFVQFGDSGNSTVFIKNKRTMRTLEQQQHGPRDEEEKAVPQVSSSSQRDPSGSANVDKIDGLAPSESIFTWKNVNYTVPYQGGTRQLLDNVSGWIKPGEVVALMGLSGAGKTTLLNLLSLRLNMGEVSGDVLVDGKEPPISFPRQTGFAEQADVHDKTQTVREALEFSALLRQPASVPKEEKLAYVDKIIQLLELEPLEDALIGSEESGLTVEQRKRVTIGVEFAAKPSLLTFLDEPTSGLDSSGAWQIGKFLRRLANSGQTALVTLHQPSSELFTTFFDRIVLLEPGGRVTYFGPVGGVIQYFEKYGGRKAAEGENIAEYAVEIVSKPRADGQKWGDIWFKSEEFQAVQNHIDEIVTERKPRPPVQIEDGDKEFAASTMEQTRLLTKRLALNFWRDPSYAYGKIATSFLVSIFSAFTFYQLGESIVDTQGRMFANFFIILILPALANASIPKHFDLKGIWTTREAKSKTYNWVALVTAMLVNEIPWAILTAVLYWAIYYWPIGWVDIFGEKAIYSFLMVLAVQMFVPTWIHWLCALAESPGFVANALPFFLVVLNLINGVLVPYESLPPPWKYWLYYMNPMVYALSGFNGMLLHNQPVHCNDREITHVNPPSGQTCMQFLGDFVQQRGLGLYNGDASSDCQVCQFTIGDQYLEGINAQHHKAWYYYAIVILFCISNVVLVYLFFYLFQIKKISLVPQSIQTRYNALKKRVFGSSDEDEEEH